MAETTFADPFDEEPEDLFGREGMYWDDLLEWETEQVFQDQQFEEYDEDYAPDAYDQYEYMLDHQDDE